MFEHPLRHFAKPSYMSGSCSKKLGTTDIDPPRKMRSNGAILWFFSLRPILRETISQIGVQQRVPPFRILVLWWGASLPHTRSRLQEQLVQKWISRHLVRLKTMDPIMPKIQFHSASHHVRLHYCPEERIDGARWTHRNRKRHFLCTILGH
jgi:hypothetical protein